MSYEKIGWVSGETPLSATNLNHMEEGISTIDSAVGTDAYDPTKTYSKGDYFIYNDSLCKAIADIAAGAELLSGVNYSTTTVHEELTELNSNLLKIQVVTISTPSELANNSSGYVDKTITFSGFTSIKAIIPVMNMYDSPSTSTDYGYISASVLSKTIESATIRIFKAYGAYVYPQFDVYVIGI